MKPTEQMNRLMARVARRELLGRVARGLQRGLLVGTAAALGWMLASRLGGLLADPPLWMLGVGVALCAVLGAVFGTRRLARGEAARLVDLRTSSKDLFLAATYCQGAAGFGCVVEAQAEARAGEIVASKVVPFVWQRALGQALGALALVAAATMLLPRLDPFGRSAIRAKQQQQVQRLEEMRKATVARTQQVTQKLASESAVKKALSDLEKTLKTAKPKEREKNLQKLSEHQKELGEVWRQLNQEIPRDNFERAAQSFGRAEAKKSEQWREALKKGDVSELKKEIEAVREQLKQLAASPDTAEKRALQEKIAQQLQSMAEAAKQGAGSPQVNAAMARALEQLAQAKGESSQEALQDAMESLGLTEQELEQLAQQLAEQKSLEQAMQATQAAKQLAGQGQLDGQAMQGNGMADYNAMFADKMKELAGGEGEGEGEGKGKGKGKGGSGMGEGIGDGSKRPENDAAKTAFTPEKNTGALTGGKMLMEWTNKEVSKSDPRSEAYRESLREVQQGVSEAIVSERVPPGYRAAIQKYFDSLPEK